MEAKVSASLDAHIDVFKKLKENYLPEIVRLGKMLWECLEKGGKVLVAGNGGSAADAQHFAAELVGRYMKERNALASIALTVDTSLLTAVGNDYGFDQIFSRQVEGLGKPGDIFLAISTSGNSPNLVRALESASQIGVTSIALLGKTGGSMKEHADHSFIVPSNETPRIQEAHEWIWHTWCDLIDQYHQ